MAEDKTPYERGAERARRANRGYRVLAAPPITRTAPLSAKPVRTDEEAKWTTAK